jgi:pSer/pThr/pTyr-binding forkhead associated (FHA) protein
LDRPHSIAARDADVQIYIKDVRSSNGTFVNGERLSAEGAESSPEELKHEDLVVRLALTLFS